MGSDAFFILFWRFVTQCLYFLLDSLHLISGIVTTPLVNRYAAAAPEQHVKYSFSTLCWWKPRWHDYSLAIFPPRALKPREYIFPKFPVYRRIPSAERLRYLYLSLIPPSPLWWQFITWPALIRRQPAKRLARFFTASSGQRRGLRLSQFRIDNIFASRTPSHRQRHSPATAYLSFT